MRFKKQASVLRPGKSEGIGRDGKWHCPRTPSCTLAQALKHNSRCREANRRIDFEIAMKEINRVAGGDPRHIRRAMARAKAKRDRG